MAEAFDTLTATEDLQTGGFDESQSKSLAKVIKTAVVGNVATKGDLDSLRQELKSELKLLEHRMKLWIVSAIGIGIGIIKALDYLLPSLGL